LKYKGHVKENLKLGHNFYCSRICLSRHHNKQVFLTCQNPNCKKLFRKQRKEISPHNYCSRSCAAILNNKKYPKRSLLKRFCVECNKEFKGRYSKYCSPRCGYRNRKTHGFKYTQAQAISLIQEYYHKNNRVPAKREIVELTGRVPNMFGSWNTAIESAGLTPNRSHDNRMYKRLNGKAADGHKCDSVSEILIDNWLHKNKIKHLKNVPYPNTNHIADWAINNDRIFIEYFGLANDSPRYDRCITEKKLLCKEGRIKLIEIYPKDLYPKNLLNLRLSKLKIS